MAELFDALRLARVNRTLLTVELRWNRLDKAIVVSEGFRSRDTAWFVVYEDDEDKDIIVAHSQIQEMHLCLKSAPSA